MNSVLNKLLSARFILAIIAGITFMILAINEILDPKDSLMTIMVVLTFYYQKQRPNEPNDKVA